MYSIFIKLIKSSSMMPLYTFYQFINFKFKMIPLHSSSFQKKISVHFVKLSFCIVTILENVLIVKASN